MKAVIFAGDYGTRLSEETHALPKSMVTISSMPILWHIMKYYSSFGFNELKRMDTLSDKKVLEGIRNMEQQ